MYKIINAKDGSTVGSTEKLYFIRKKESTGCYIPADEKSAQGIAYKSTAYNIQGKDGVGADDTVFLIEYDAGIETDKNSAAIAENSVAIDNIIISMLEG